MAVALKRLLTLLEAFMYRRVNRKKDQHRDLWQAAVRCVTLILNQFGIAMAPACRWAWTWVSLRLLFRFSLLHSTKGAGSCKATDTGRCTCSGYEIDDDGSIATHGGALQDGKRTTGCDWTENRLHCSSEGACCQKSDQTDSSSEIPY
jgi:hypothetical protein